MLFEHVFTLPNEVLFCSILFCGEFKRFSISGVNYLLIIIKENIHVLFIPVAERKNSNVKWKMSEFFLRYVHVDML